MFKEELTKIYNPSSSQHTYNTSQGLIITYLNKGNNKITEQSYKGKVKTHNYINRQNQSTTGKL
jgi:hypothetical protein